MVISHLLSGMILQVWGWDLDPSYISYVVDGARKPPDNGCPQTWCLVSRMSSINSMAPVFLKEATFLGVSFAIMVAYLG